MKINFSIQEICQLTNGLLLNKSIEERIESISYDTRKIGASEHVLFCALKGNFRDGHDFIKDAYNKGIRLFLVDEKEAINSFEDATFILVKNTLWALQEVAKIHRLKFNYPIIAITGSIGKTMVKEWIYHFFSSKFRVIRSPKSYNSQLGVALSLLELTSNYEIAIIEVGISKSNEMERLKEIIQPTIGVFTAFGSAHRENFSSKEEHFEEKINLFSNCKKTFVHNSINLSKDKLNQLNGIIINPNLIHPYKKEIPFNDNVSIHNLEIAVQLAEEFSIPKSMIHSKIESLPRLALRMETFEGINGNLIINDTYNLDFDALTQSLEYQLSIAENRSRIVVIGLDEESKKLKENIEKIILPFHPEKVFFTQTISDLKDIHNSVILIKGSRKADMQRFSKQFRLKNHTTFLEIDLNAIRNNLKVFKSYLNPTTKILAMVKSNSYGTGAERMATFFEKQGVNYLGVAYVDEGVELRKQGITLPILVMNAQKDGFEDCINYNLEPAIYSLKQLDLFIKELILEGRADFPIHIKFNTGMNRLGFEIEDIHQLIETFQAQPEVKIKSVYSHLSDSDNFTNDDFTKLQIERFEKACHQLQKHINYSFDRHLLNSEAVSRFPHSQYEMVRLGIGMYGYSTNPDFKQKLRSTLFWKSSISQIKTIHAGDSIGYGRSFIAAEKLTIAIIPVGYADGFRRSLSNGKGAVYIKNKRCEVLGRVCMDMIMVNISGIEVSEGDNVEIIGPNQSMEDFAKQMDTISYEVMTGFSKRVHRVYLEN